MPRYTQFPAAEWDPVFSAFLDEETTFVNQDWHRLVALDAPLDDSDGECSEVTNRESEQNGRRPEIDAEETGLEGALWPIIETWKISGVTGQNWTQRDGLPKTWELLLLATFDLRPGLFQLKKRFNRGRPFHFACAQGVVKPLFRPGHPSYPGGHAAQGEMAVLLLEHGVRVKPNLVAAMRVASDRVSDNRVVAGIHFPSDAVSGQRLAEQFVPMLLASEPFQALCDEARAELTVHGVV